MNEVTRMAHRDCIDTSWRFPAYRLSSVLGPAGRHRLLPNLLSRIVAWRERARSRYLLQLLDDRMLRDVGLSRSDVDSRVRQAFLATLRPPCASRSTKSTRSPAGSSAAIRRP